MHLTTAVLIVLAAAVVRGEDECAPPKPGEKHVHAGECCKIDRDSITPKSFKEGMKICMDKHPMPPAGAKPDAAAMNEFACLAECVFEEAKVLTSDKKLDKDALTKAVADAPPDLKTVFIAAVDKCIDVEVDSTLITKCKSGADEFQNCFKREVFLNCPSSLSTSNADCDGLKDLVTKCPMTPIMLAMGI